MKFYFHTATCVGALLAASSLMHTSSAEMGTFMKLKKMAALCMAMVMTASLAGCGSSDSTGAAQGGEAADTTASAEGSSEVGGGC